MSHSYRYKTDGYGPYEFEMNIDITDDLEWMAQEAAENFHSEHDGWEGSWPREFTMLDADGNELGTCEVEREYEPSFSATANHPASTDQSIESDKP